MKFKLPNERNPKKDKKKLQKNKNISMLFEDPKCSNQLESSCKKILKANKQSAGLRLSLY